MSLLYHTANNLS